MPKPTIVLLGSATENTDVLLYRGEYATVERNGRLFTDAAFARLSVLSQFQEVKKEYQESYET